MTGNVKGLLSLLLIAASFAPSLAQGPLPQGKQRIALNVVAFDNRNGVVTDLSRQDFKVFDQGKSQQISFFQRNDKPAPVVIVYDMDSNSLNNRNYAIDELSKYLESAELTDALYFYVIAGGRLTPIHALPSAKIAVIADETPWNQHVRPLLERALQQSPIQSYPTFVGAAIDALASELAPFPGRKNILLVTRSGMDCYIVPGQAIDSRYKCDNENQRRATALDNAGITLNSLDQANDPGSSTRGAMEQFAELTGGVVYPRDIGEAVDQVTAASGSGYLIEYDAPPRDRKYHKIRVTSTRTGVRLQFKQGYNANP